MNPTLSPLLITEAKQAKPESQGMQHPSWTFDRVVQNYCTTPPAVALLE